MLGCFIQTSSLITTMSIVSPSPIKTPCSCMCRHTLRQINRRFPELVPNYDDHASAKGCGFEFVHQSEMRKILEDFEDPAKTGFVPTLEQINMLILCHCCERHQQDKTRINESSFVCDCSCRNMVRWLCRVDPDCSIEYPEMIDCFETASYQPMDKSTYIKINKINRDWSKQLNQTDSLCYGSFLQLVNPEERSELFYELWSCRCCKRHQINKTKWRMDKPVAERQHKPPSTMAKIQSHNHIIKRIISRKRSKTSPPKFAPSRHNIRLAQLLETAKPAPASPPHFRQSNNIRPKQVFSKQVMTKRRSKE